MKSFCSRFLRLLFISFLSCFLILCLNFDNRVKAETSETYKPTDTFISEVIKVIKSHIQELPANPKYVMYYDVLAKRYYFYFSTKGDELHSYKWVYGDARQTYIKIKGKNVVRIYTDNNQNIQTSDFVSVLDENIQNEDFTRFIFNTATLGNGLSFNKKFVLLEEKFNDGGMTSQDKGFMSGLFNGLINALLAPLNLIKSAVDAVSSAVSSIGSLIVNALGSLGSLITGALSDLGSSLINFLSKVQNAIVFIVRWLGDFIIDGLKSLFIPDSETLETFMINFKEQTLFRKLGALGQSIDYFTSFVGSLVSFDKKFVFDLPPIYLNDFKVIDFDYDLSSLLTTYKQWYDLYYLGISISMVMTAIGFVASQFEDFFKE